MGESVDDEVFSLLGGAAAVGEHEVHAKTGEGAEDVGGLLDRDPQGTHGVELFGEHSEGAGPRISSRVVAW